MKCVVEFFELKDGVYPAKDFIISIHDVKLKNKTLRTIQLLQEYGNDLRGTYSEYLEDGIFELRSKQSSNITRVLYFFYVDNVVVLTHGFIKKTQKTPKKEIQKAKTTDRSI